MNEIRDYMIENGGERDRMNIKLLVAVKDRGSPYDERSITQEAEEMYKNPRKHRPGGVHEYATGIRQKGTPTQPRRKPSGKTTHHVYSRYEAMAESEAENAVNNEGSLPDKKTSVTHERKKEKVQDQFEGERHQNQDDHEEYGHDLPNENEDR